MTLTHILQLAAILLGLYALVAAIYLVLENRTPQSTFAWLFLFLLVPLAGIVAYRFAGRGWQAFSKENELAQQELDGDLVQDLRPILARQQEYIDRLATAHPESYRRKLIQLVQRNGSSLFTARNEVTILQDASEKYPRLLADLRAARHHIHLNYYIWTEDSFTIELKDVLIERARSGVKIRCLYDASGGALGKGYLRDLTDAGIAIHPYLEFRSFTKLHSINYRSHRKIAVIDGRIGYTGGLNLDKEQLHPTAFPAWRDTHLRVVGEAAQGLQASFAVSWFNTTGEEYHDPEYYPPVADGHFLPVQIVQSGPDSQWQAIRQLYFQMIVSAERSIQLQSPFFIPDESIVEALRAAALAGVDVQLMFTPRGGKYQIPYRAAHTYFQAVAEAGARIFLYQDAYFHPKTINIDNAVIAVGTANVDIRSFSINYETVAVIYDQSKAQELATQFAKDLQHCEEWTVAAYLRTPLSRRLLDSLYRLASPLL
ncbi:MAG: cardiolipin synthase [Thermomicrobiales bacterium]